MSLVLGLGLEHSCPWPREVLSSERLSLALASDFFCVLGFGLEPCVLDSTSFNSALSNVPSVNCTITTTILINEIFDRKLNKIIDALQTSNTRTQQGQPPRQKGNYRPNYCSNRQPFYCRLNDGSRQTYRPRFNTYNQQSYFKLPKNFQTRSRGSAASSRK